MRPIFKSLLVLLGASAVAIAALELGARAVYRRYAQRPFEHAEVAARLFGAAPDETHGSPPLHAPHDCSRPAAASGAPACVLTNIRVCLVITPLISKR